jgi:hypothetical protein
MGLERHVGADRDRFAAGEMRGFLVGPGIDVGYRRSRTFARQQDGGGSADAAAGAGDEGGLTCEPRHRSSP